MATEPDYGEAINLVGPDRRMHADMSGPMVTVFRAVLMRVLARLFTLAGSLFYALDVGCRVPVHHLENITDDTDFAQIAAEYGAEAEREQGVVAASAVVTRDSIDPRRVRVSVTCDLTTRTVGLNLIVTPGQAALVLFSGV